MPRAGTNAPREWIAWLAALLGCVGVCLLYQRIAWTYGFESATGSFAAFPPLFAEPQTPSPPTSRVLAAAVPGLVTLGLAALALGAERRLPTALLLLAAPGLVAWQNVAAAGIDGPSAWREPFRRSAIEYLGDVAHVERLGPAAFAREYPRLIAEVTTPAPNAGRAALPPLTLHGATHPPGGALLLWAGLRLWGDTRIDSVPMDVPPRDRLPESVVARASAIAIGLTALAVLATAGLAWLGHGRRAAAVAATLHVVTPSLVWFGATSMDGVFLLATASVLLPFECALGERSARAGLGRAVRLGVALGLAAAIASVLTYAAVLLALLFALRLAGLFALDRKAAARGAVACGIGAITWLAIQLLLRLTVGFDPVASVSASIAMDQALVGSGYEGWARYLDVSVANGVGFALGCGPPTVALVACAAARGGRALRDRRAGVADAAALAWALAVTLAAGSTLFTFELERIWLFLIPPALAIAAGELCRALHGWRGLAWATSVAALLLLAETLVLEAWLYTWW